MKRGISKNIFENCIQDVCKEGPIITDNELGEITCGSCGTILVEKTIECGPENHYFTKENYMANTRFGPKIKLSFGDMGLSTFIRTRLENDYLIKLEVHFIVLENKIKFPNLKKTEFLMRLL